DTMYLINIHNNPGICVIRDNVLPLPIDCGSITQSQYATLLGIPLAYLGFLYYLSIIIVFLYRDQIKINNYTSKTILSVIIGFGMLFSIYLVILQLFVLKLICLYCMGSALTTTVLFSLHFYTLNK
ncbi:MAG: vitamin K epoxide reductase family protein, partial [Candidatus Kariarchaeaceae archaeon]